MVKVYFTELAYLQLLVEVKKYCRVETGAILIGQIIDNNYYVFESLDSGINCRRSPAIFYRDNPYSEHLADVVRAKYTRAYAIGFWHRHPGNFNQFSNTDLEANIDMARVMQGDIISGLVNVFDNKVHLRFWQITLDNKYEEAEIIVGDRHFANILAYKSKFDVERQIVANESGETYQAGHVISCSTWANNESSQDTSQQSQKKKKPCGIKSLFRKKDKKANQPSESNGAEAQANILKTIYDDLSILLSRRIKCEKYRIEDPKQQDKVLLSFCNPLNNKQCDVLLYLDDGNLIFVIQGKYVKYEKEILAKEVLSVLEDNNGPVITTL